MGPWRHGGSNGDGNTLGPLHFDSDTALNFRRRILQPFLDQYLKDQAPIMPLAPVVAFETGSNLWHQYASWPQSCASGCPAVSRKLYLEPNHALGFDAPAANAAAYDSYISDPARPLPSPTCSPAPPARTPTGW
jgi:predicted acyl esterase